MEKVMIQKPYKTIGFSTTSEQGRPIAQNALKTNGKSSFCETSDSRNTAHNGIENTFKNTVRINGPRADRSGRLADPQIFRIVSSSCPFDTCSCPYDKGKPSGVTSGARILSCLLE